VVVDALESCFHVVPDEGSRTRTSTSYPSSSASSADTAARCNEHEISPMEQTRAHSSERPGSSNSRTCRNLPDSLSQRQPCEPVAREHILDFFACRAGADVAAFSPVARAPMLWHRDTQTQQLTHAETDSLAASCHGSSEHTKQRTCAKRCGPNESLPRCLARRLGCGANSVFQITVSDIKASAASDARLGHIHELLIQPAAHMHSSQRGTCESSPTHTHTYTKTQPLIHFDKFSLTGCDSRPEGPSPQILTSPCGKGDSGESFAHLRGDSHRVVTPGPGEVTG